MKAVIFSVCFCLIALGLAQTIQGSDQIANSSAPATGGDSTLQEGLYAKGSAFLASGRLSEAAEALRQATERNPNDAAAYAKLGIAYAALPQYQEAVVVLKMAAGFRISLQIPAISDPGLAVFACEPVGPYSLESSRHVRSTSRLRAENRF